MKSRPTCPKCGSGNVYFRTDKSMTCRRCGYDSRDDNIYKNEDIVVEQLEEHINTGPEE